MHKNHKIAPGTLSTKLLEIRDTHKNGRNLSNGMFYFMAGEE